MIWTRALKRRSPSIHFNAQVAIAVALALLLIFGGLRYDNFLSAYNISNVLSYNAMFALVALGMTFVIVTGGIDLSIGAVAALGSVVAALASSWGLPSAVLAGVVSGAAVGLVNGLAVGYLRLPPFIVTLATMLAARGIALMISGNRSVPISTSSGFKDLGTAKFLGVPLLVIFTLLFFIAGAGMLRYSSFGRTALAIGGNEEAARLMGLPVRRTLVAVYCLCGGLAGLAGAVLAARGYAGQPTEGVGWELVAIASVVVGGTLLTGGVGSVGGTLLGVLLFGFIYNILNFENGKGWISLSAHWQSVLRGLLLLTVVLAQTRFVRRDSDGPPGQRGNVRT
jgi:ribose transport system permease protein